MTKRPSFYYTPVYENITDKDTDGELVDNPLTDERSRLINIKTLKIVFFESFVRLNVSNK